jgi:glutamate racemase
MAIGIFDSGLGGRTVLQELQALLPHENFIYFADSAHLPYGDKSADYLARRIQAILDFFETQKVKLVLAACHTASTNALHLVHAPLPLLGIVDAALTAIGKKKVALLATPATIRSGVYQKRLGAQLIKAVPCPQFASLIEEGALTDALIQETLRPLASLDLEGALLGSTHYPLVQERIQKVIGLHVPLINPAAQFAQEARAFLQEHALFNPQLQAGSCTFFSSQK